MSRARDRSEVLEAGAPASGHRPGAPNRWLHRRSHALLLSAARVYYRVSVTGPPIPSRGPVLLVANHPNSLLDPALVALSADRPVRFLARAGLFDIRSIGWLVRGSGAIPVYRRGEPGASAERKVGMFAAATSALVQGAAVGIFPEGLSHSEPSLAPMKTGAARIALQAREEGAGAFPIVPVGLTFRGGKERFRSEALLLRGRPISWEDLAGEGSESPDAVRALTDRIEGGLGRVTVNLRSWDDFPIVEGAEAIHQAERGRSPGDPVRWLARMRRTASTLERAREADAAVRGADSAVRETDPAVREPDATSREPLADDIVRHVRLLDSLGLRPRDLHDVPPFSVAARWTLKNLLFFGIAAPLAVIGAVIFYLPYRLVGSVEARWDLPHDKRATYKVLGGTAAFGGWIVAIAAILRELAGWRPALAVLLVLPLLGILTIYIRDRWKAATSDLRRFLVLRGRRDLRQRLIERQAGIAARLRGLQRELGGGRRGE